MTEKLVVQFDQLPVYDSPLDYLAYCMGCNTYHMNDQKPCIKCGKADVSVSLECIAEKTVKRHFLNGMGILVMLYALMFVVSMSWTAIFWGTVYTIVCIVLYGGIYLRYKEAYCKKELEKHVRANSQRIKLELEKQWEVCKEQMNNGDYLGAYEKLRYLSQLVDNEEIRVYKLICLNHFHLRKDLPLELKTVLLPDCNMLLIRYIYEVAKLKKELIDEATINYILRYRQQVLTEEKGEEIVASVLGGALRSKFLLNKYALALKEYLPYLPKERLLRLRKIQDGISDEALREEIISQIATLVGEE